jgi:hypothetical protein
MLTLDMPRYEQLMALFFSNLALQIDESTYLPKPLCPYETSMANYLSKRKRILACM